eukprot:gene8570-14573_t
MAKRDLFLFGGIAAAIGLALLPIYAYPKFNPNGYNNVQERNREGLDREAIQPGGMKIWNDPFDRKKNSSGEE